MSQIKKLLNILGVQMISKKLKIQFVILIFAISKYRSFYISLFQILIPKIKIFWSPHFFKSTSLFWSDDIHETIARCYLATTRTIVLQCNIVYSPALSPVDWEKPSTSENDLHKTLHPRISLYSFIRVNRYTCTALLYYVTSRFVQRSIHWRLCLRGCIFWTIAVTATVE